jgi:hypothetical protein
VSRRNRSNRRRAYGKRQHEVRDRRPTDAIDADGSRRDDGWIAPELIDDTTRRDADGWAR